MLGSGLSNWLHIFFLGNNKSRMPRLGGKGEVGLKDWFCVDLYRPRECVWRSKTRTSTQKRVFLRNAKVEQVENHHTHAHTHGKIELSFSHFLFSLSPFYLMWRHTHPRKEPRLKAFCEECETNTNFLLYTFFLNRQIFGWRGIKRIFFLLLTNAKKKIITILDFFAKIILE